MPRSRAASALSITRPAAPMPTIKPWRRRSKGAAFPRSVCALDYKASGAHAHDQAVAAAVKGSGGFFHHFVRGGGTASQETRATPFDRMIGRDVVGRDHDHATARPIIRSNG